MFGCLAAPILGDPSRSAADPYRLHSDLIREEPLWGDRPTSVDIDVADAAPLVGMALLKGHTDEEAYERVPLNAPDAWATWNRSMRPGGPDEEAAAQRQDLVVRDSPRGVGPRWCYRATDPAGPRPPLRPEFVGLAGVW